MNWIKNAWQGKTPLWKVFWIYGVIGNNLLMIICSAMIGNLTSIIISMVIMFAYTIWILVSQWRCAFNTKWRGWGYIVRILAIIAPLLFITGLILGGIVVGSDLINAAECRVELRDRKEAGESIPDTEEFLEQCRKKREDNDTPIIKEIKKSHSIQSEEKEVTDPSQDSPLTEAPLDAAPLPSITGSAPDTQKYKEACEKTLTDYAIAGGADPAQYLAENQDYVQKCIEFHESENKP